MFCKNFDISKLLQRYQYQIKLDMKGCHNPKVELAK